MPRSRMIKPEFWSDEKLAGVSFEARLVFIGLWTWAMIAGSTIDAAKRALARKNEQLGEN